MKWLTGDRCKAITLTKDTTINPFLSLPNTSRCPVTTLYSTFYFYARILSDHGVLWRYPLFYWGPVLLPCGGPTSAEWIMTSLFPFALERTVFSCITQPFKGRLNWQRRVCNFLWVKSRYILDYITSFTP